MSKMEKSANKGAKKNVHFASEGLEQRPEEGTKTSERLEQVKEEPELGRREAFKLLVITIRSLDTQYSSFWSLDKADPMLKLSFNGVNCSTPPMSNNENPHFNQPFSFLMSEETQRSLGIIEGAKGGAGEARGDAAPASSTKSNHQSSSSASDRYLHFEVVEKESIQADRQVGERKVHINEYLKGGEESNRNELIRKGLKSVDVYATANNKNKEEKKSQSGSKLKASQDGKAAREVANTTPETAERALAGKIDFSFELLDVHHQDDLFSDKPVPSTDFRAKAGILLVNLKHLVGFDEMVKKD